MPRPQISAFSLRKKPISWLVIQFTSHPNCQRAVPGSFDESNASGGDTEECRAGARDSAVAPRDPVRRRAAGSVSPVISWMSLGFTPCGKPARAGRLDRIGGRRRFTSPEGQVSVAVFLRKEVIQPQVPLRLPCYDLVPIRSFIFGACLSAPATSDAPPFGGLTGGVYKAQEHIHRGNADPRLLAIPTSWTRIAESNLNWGTVFAICSTSRSRVALSGPL